MTGPSFASVICSLALAFSITMMGCAQSTSKPTDPGSPSAGYKLFQLQDGCTIEIPEGWRPKETSPGFFQFRWDGPDSLAYVTCKTKRIAAAQPIEDIHDILKDMYSGIAPLQVDQVEHRDGLGISIIECRLPASENLPISITEQHCTLKRGERAIFLVFSASTDNWNELSPVATYVADHAFIPE